VGTDREKGTGKIDDGGVDFFKYREGDLADEEGDVHTEPGAEFHEKEGTKYIQDISGGGKQCIDKTCGVN